MTCTVCLSVLVVVFFQRGGRGDFFGGGLGIDAKLPTGDGDDANRAQDTLTEASTVKRAVSGASER